VSSNEGKRGNTIEQVGARVPVYTAPFALFRFSLGSLRGRVGQTIPVTLALLLIVGVAQAIGALGNVSSTLARQQIAASWRAPADLLVRPQAAVSQPERSAGWINPGGALEYYGGISAGQLATISTLSQVAQILPFASIGWQRIDIVTPVVLQQQGLYRITAQWTGAQQSAGNVVDYVEVSDLASLVNEEPVLMPVVQHLLLPPNAPSVVYAMSVPALQLLVGTAPTQQSTLRQLLLEGSNPASFAGLTIRVDKLNGQLTMLTSCIAQAIQAACWQHVMARTDPSSYLAQDVQLVRYSQAHYSASPQQLAAGQLTLNALGEDTQGPVYRELLAQHVILASDGATSLAKGTGQETGVVPLMGPEQMALLPSALQFIPLDSACLVNGERCYSGLYIRPRGVDRYNSKSLALLQATAAAITARTGLHVDILDGSSTRIVTLESGNANMALPLQWRVVGVAVRITHGVDALQKTLFILCALICLLATGAAGVLIGTGRRNEARILEQLGWSSPLRAGAYIFDALLLALPGCLLASLLIVLADKFWPGNVPSLTMWALLACGAIIYGISLVSLACGIPALLPVRKRTRAAQAPPPHPFASKSIVRSSAFHTRVTAPLVCAIAITSTIFLIAEEYFIVSGLNRELVVTVLGEQVHVALEGPQFLLLLLVLLTALLTVGSCTSLLLRGRRQELMLLAKVGWERRHVLLRLLRESWWMAALSGMAGALLALGVIGLAGSMPPLWVVGSVIAGGPLLGMALASLVVYTLAWQELKSIYLKRA